MKKTTPPTPPSSEPQTLTRENYLDGLSYDLTHDEFFKQTFGLKAIAIAFLRFVLDAALIAKLDLDRLTIVDTAYFDESFKDYHADMVYMIPLRDGGELYIHIIVEHKSVNDFEAIVQLANYVMEIHKIIVRKLRKGKKKWNKNTRLSIVIPIIFHHGNRAFTGATQLSDVIQKLPGADKYQIQMQAILFDLSTMQIEDIPHVADCPELWPVLMIMKTVFNKKDVLDHLDEIMAELKPYLDNPHYLQLTRLCIHYVVSSNSRQLDDEDITKIDETLYKTIGGKNMPQFKNSYWNSGVAVGEARGAARGERQRLITNIQTSIRKNCHVAQVPADIEEELNNRQDIFVLESLFEDSFDCTSLDEFRQKL